MDALQYKSDLTRRKTSFAISMVISLSAIVLCLTKTSDRLLLSCCIPFLLFLPFLTEKMLGVYFTCMVTTVLDVYTLGPMLGHCFNFYTLIPFWDKMLHFTGGVVFALFGYMISVRTCTSNRRIHHVIMAICVAMAISVAWEFFEYGSDMLFGTDQQNDTLISVINSNMLDDDLTTVTSVQNILSVNINGVVLDGYLDIGLIDTMNDMLIETLGALLFCFAIWLNKWNTDRLFIPREALRLNPYSGAKMRECPAGHAN